MANTVDPFDCLRDLEGQLLTVPQFVVFEFYLEIKLRFYHGLLQSSLNGPNAALQTFGTVVITTAFAGFLDSPR